MNDKAREYYELWAEHLKICCAYQEVIEAVESAREYKPLAADFEQLDFSDPAEFEKWQDWIKDAHENLPGIVYDNYGELLATTYPFFQDVNSDNDKQYLKRIELAHVRRKKEIKNRVSSGSCFVEKIILHHLSQSTSANPNVTASDFAKTLVEKIKSLDADRSYWERCPGWINSSDFFTVLVKFTLTGSRTELVNQFKKYIKQQNGVFDVIFEYWDIMKRLNVFMDVPPNTQIAPVEMHLKCLLLHLAGKKKSEIKLIVGKSKDTNDDDIRVYIEDAEDEIKNLVSTGVFIKESSTHIKKLRETNMVADLSDFEEIV